MLSVSLKRCKNEALKIKHFKNIKCFKEVGGGEKTSDSFSTIDCCVGINHQSDGLLNGDIQS